MLLMKGILWFDSGGSLGLFRLSDVCRLMVAIFAGCILDSCKKLVCVSIIGSRCQEVCVSLTQQKVILC